MTTQRREEITRCSRTGPTCSGDRHCSASLALALLAWAPPTQARVTRIVVDTKTSPAFGGQSFGAAGQYETIAGRAFGELDPDDPHNAIIQDIDLAPRNANGNVEYVATFFLVKPIDMSQEQRPDVARRAEPRRPAHARGGEPDDGDVALSSGWQGDNSGATVARAQQRLRRGARREERGRLVDHRARHGAHPQRQRRQFAADHRALEPGALRPATLDTTQATLTTHASRDHRGRASARRPKIASSDWAWASCSATNPFPGRRPTPTQICLKSGFDPATALPGRVHGQGSLRARRSGFAAFRDVASFFKHQLAGRRRHAEPAWPAATQLGHHPRESRSRGTSSAGFSTSASTRTRPAVRCTTAPGRSSPAGASP